MVLKGNDKATLALMQERLNRMQNVKSVQNIKAGGCMKALTREIRNLSTKLDD